MKLSLFHLADFSDSVCQTVYLNLISMFKAHFESSPRLLCLLMKYLMYENPFWTS